MDYIVLYCYIMFTYLLMINLKKKILYKVEYMKNKVNNEIELLNNKKSQNEKKNIMTTTQSHQIDR